MGHRSSADGATLKRGPVGGAAADGGSVHRAGVTALVVVQGLMGQSVSWLPQHGVPIRITVEADAHIDDLVVDFNDGTRAYVQAKLSCDLGVSLGAVAAQWAASLEAGELSARSSAVLAVANPSLSLRHLAAALDNLRNGTPVSGAQEKALGKLRAHLTSHLPERSNVEPVLRASYIAVVDGRESDTGAAWLAGTVVSATSGRHAFDTIRAAIPRLAAARGHATLEDWRAWLRHAGVPTHADPQGVVAARRQAENNELIAYRAELATTAGVLPLGVLGAGRASLRIDGLAESLTVGPLDRDRTTRRGRPSDMETDEWLVWVRRKARLLLVGQPGSGKSVALQQTAARLASLPFAPVPIQVSLRQVAEIMGGGRAAVLQIGELIELSVPGRSATLRQALEARVRDGQAVLLLDALDETGAHLDDVVAGLRALLNTAHSDLGIIVSSRHSSLDAAIDLDLRPRLLTQPRHLDDDMDAVLQSLAPNLADEQRRSWLATRRTYIAESRKKLPEIWSVPLLAVLATGLVAANRTAPATRASLLTAIIDQSVRSWETRRKEALLPGADRKLTADILTDTFGDLAVVVADDGDWQAAQQSVVNRLKGHWGLSAGTAGAVADAIIEHWDATAAVFVTDSPRGRLRPQVRLFAEIGEALYRSRERDELVPWARSVAEDAGRQETMRLTAGLSPANMATLSAVATHIGAAPALDAVSEAWQDGQQPTPADADALVQAQFTLLRTESTAPPPRKGTGIEAFLGDRASPFVHRAIRICRLPLSDDQCGQLLALCSDLSDAQRNVLAGIARFHQQPDKSASDVALDAVERLLLTDEEIAGASERVRKRSLHGISELLGLTADTILDQRPHLARRLAYTAEQTTNGTYTRVRSSAARRGLQDELPTMARDYATVNRQIESYRRGQIALFQVLRAALPDAAGALTPRAEVESRRIRTARLASEDREFQWRRPPPRYPPPPGSDRCPDKGDRRSIASDAGHRRRTARPAPSRESRRPGLDAAVPHRWAKPPTRGDDGTASPAGRARRVADLEPLAPGSRAAALPGSRDSHRRRRPRASRRSRHASRLRSPRRRSGPKRPATGPVHTRPRCSDPRRRGVGRRRQRSSRRASSGRALLPSRSRSHRPRARRRPSHESHRGRPCRGTDGAGRTSDAMDVSAVRADVRRIRGPMRRQSSPSSALSRVTGATGRPGVQAGETSSAASTRSLVGSAEHCSRHGC